MKPRDLLRIGDRVWEVQGVYLGGNNQESVIECSALGVECSREPGDGMLYIPELMLREAINYSAVEHYTLAPELEGT